MTHTARDIDIIRLSLLSTFPGLIHGTSTRKFGSIKERGIVFPDNFLVFSQALGIDADKTVFTKQVHGADVAVVTDTEVKILQDKDGLVTKEKGVYIGMATADCLPIVFYDPKQSVIGVAHVGYKGLVKGLIAEMVRSMEALGSNVQNILVGIGPGIGVCCYEFGKDMVGLFSKYNDSYQMRNGTYYVDLKGIVKQELRRNDITEVHIEIADLCTKSRMDLFFSARGDTKETFGEMATIIGMI